MPGKNNWQDIYSSDRNICYELLSQQEEPVKFVQQGCNRMLGWSNLFAGGIMEKYCQAKMTVMALNVLIDVSRRYFINENYYSLSYEDTFDNLFQVEDEPDKVHASDRESVKGLILHLMLTSPEAIQKQLSDATAIIGKHDFPDKWPSLITDMVAKFSSGDFHVMNGVLHTAHSLFKRYRHEFKSQQLWTEIKFVLDNFAKPFTELFQVPM